MTEKEHLFIQSFLNEATFDGWSEKSFKAASLDVYGSDVGAYLDFEDGLDSAAKAFAGWVDEKMQEKLSKDTLSEMKIRERIAALIMSRIEVMAPHQEAVRGYVSYMAHPMRIKLASSLTWKSADIMWRMAGDTSTDWNHYSKRTLLSGVYSSTILFWLGQDDLELDTTRNFMLRRIDNVMQIEKVKMALKNFSLFPAKKSS